MCLFIILVPGPALLAWSVISESRDFYIYGIMMMALAILPFLTKKRGSGRPKDLIMIGIMSLIAVAARGLFVMVAQFKPMGAVVIISGMAFGPAAGFLTGTVSCFFSNFIFGQGLWTPWQMYAFGVTGFLAGIFYQKGILREKNIVRVALFGAGSVMLVLGPILDTYSLLSSPEEATGEMAVSTFLAGIPYNAVHAAAVMILLLLIEKPFMEKLVRMKVKYAMMDEGGSILDASEGHDEGCSREVDK